MFVFDAGYDPVAISEGLKHERAQVLVRLRSDRVFYTDPPAGRRPGAGGRPRRHGQRFKLSDPKERAQAHGPAPPGRPPLRQSRREGLGRPAPEALGRGRWAGEGLPPIVRGTVIRVDVERLPKPSSRANNKVLWLWWSRQARPRAVPPGLPAPLRPRAHLPLRQEHARLDEAFAKDPRASRPLDLAHCRCVHTATARTGLVDDMRLPWERPRDPALLTPARVRRGFRQLRAEIGTPANLPKSTTPGPGRPKGTTRPPRTRYPVVKKAA